MTTLFIILGLILAFGFGALVMLIVMGATFKFLSEDGEFAAAFYSKKNKRWEVLGNYLAISGKLSNLLKSDPGKVNYVQDGCYEKPKGWRVDKVKSTNFFAKRK